MRYFLNPDFNGKNEYTWLAMVYRGLLFESDVIKVRDHFPLSLSDSWVLFTGRNVDDDFEMAWINPSKISTRCIDILSLQIMNYLENY